MKRKRSRDRDWNARLFHVKSSEQYVEATEFMTRCDLDMPAHARVLDVGSGSGGTTEWVAESYPESVVLGIDNNRDMLTVARQQFPRTAHPNLSFLKMDAQSIFYLQAFNYVVSFFCLPWTDAPQAAISCIYDSLVPLGETVMIIQLRHKELWDSIEEAAKLEKWRPHFVRFKNLEPFIQTANIKS